MLWGMGLSVSSRTRALKYIFIISRFVSRCIPLYVGSRGIPLDPARSRCIPLYPAVSPISRYIPLYPSVSRCIPLYPAVSHCLIPLYLPYPAISRCIPLCPAVSRCIPLYSPVSSHIWGPDIMKNILQSTGWSRSVSRSVYPSASRCIPH